VTIGPRKLREPLTRLVLQRDEDEARPDVAVHRDEAVVGLVQVEELTLLLHERAPAVELVLPAVVLADELAAAAARLLAREVGPYQLVAAVAADVVEGADLAVHAAHDDDRRVGERELLREVAALAGELLDAPDVQPAALEDGLPLELVELG
jgi:hypothetical protein